MRSGAGLIDASDRGVVVATGPDRVDFLQGQLSNDVKALAGASGCRATLLTRKGKLISDMVVTDAAAAIRDALGPDHGGSTSVSVLDDRLGSVEDRLERLSDLEDRFSRIETAINALRSKLDGDEK